MKLLLKIAIVSLFLFSTSRSGTLYSGTLYDDRDEESYLTLKIGDYEWMAENLRYDTKHSECYDDELKNCKLFGRLYTWSDAKKVCPNGWHLPSKKEIESLATAVGNDDLLGKKMKSASRWDGSNDFGFTAVPGGYCFYDAKYDSLSCNERGFTAYFWSSSKKDGNNIYSIKLLSGTSSAKWNVLNEDSVVYHYHSVRCVRKNTEVTERYEPSTNYQEKVAPVKPTATCKDGTISFSQTRSGTCAGHGGVEKWEDSEENQNRKQRSNEVEERYEQPTYNREEYSPPQPTATCADGTTSYSQSRRGTCSGHGGVEKWENSEKKQKSKQNDFGVGSLLKLFF